MIPVFILWIFVRDGANHLVHRIVQAMMKGAAVSYMWLAGIRPEVKGLENIPEEPALFVSNHTGIFDVGAAYATVKSPTAFIGKIQAKKIPVIGQAMGLMNGLFLDRDNLKQGLQVVLSAIDHVKNGISIWVCPEGTREKEGTPTDLLPFRAGCFKIAVKTGAPVVPVVIIGSRDLFEAHKPWISGGKLKIIYGRPVYTDELPDEAKKHIGEYFRNIMIDMIKEEMQG